jgi:hypothetical protein
MWGSTAHLLFEDKTKWEEWAEAQRQDKFPLYDSPKQFPCCVFVARFYAEHQHTVVLEQGIRVFFVYKAKDGSWDIERALRETPFFS